MSLSPTYICEHCKGEFREGWTKEEANAEAERLWGLTDLATDEEAVRVCDDCFKRLMAWVPPECLKGGKP